jgi:hypothetical protein
MNHAQRAQYPVHTKQGIFAIILSQLSHNLNAWGYYYIHQSAGMAPPTVFWTWESQEARKTEQTRMDLASVSTREENTTPKRKFMQYTIWLTVVHTVFKSTWYYINFNINHHVIAAGALAVGVTRWAASWVDWGRKRGWTTTGLLSGLVLIFPSKLPRLYCCWWNS